MTAVGEGVMALNDNGLAENAPALQVCSVDGHVHLHPGFQLAPALDSARRNMALGSSPEKSVGFLLLTEIAGVDRFGALPETAGAWSISPCAEPVSMVAHRDDGCRLFIVAGRQVVTAEGLEVLVHGTAETIADGLALQEVLAAAEALGALSVLPWGVGKWTGARGRIIAALAAAPPPSDRVFLADSGVRPKAAPRPGVFADAEAKGWRVLAGTDPLPLPNQAATVGRFGFTTEFPLDPDHPFQSLAGWLRASDRSPDCYGSLQGLGGFLVKQTAMQIRKRLT